MGRSYKHGVGAIASSNWERHCMLHLRAKLRLAKQLCCLLANPELREFKAASLSAVFGLTNCLCPRFYAKHGSAVISIVRQAGWPVSMASPVGPQDTGHADTVHDVQLDYYGRKLATASSDRTIKVFDVTGDQLTPLATLHGHDGPVWQVSWSHPKFGNLLASCSFDNRVMIWKEQQDGTWAPVYTTDSSLHSASVNSVAFAPHELGLKVAAASSDGSASVLTYNTTEGKWDQQKVDAHSVGCTAVSWSPAAPPGSLVSGKPPAHAVARFATAGCDRTVRIWHFDETKRHWAQQGQPLKGHTDWVRDVAWAPNLGMPMNTVASAGQDGKVLIWTEQNNQWNQLVLCDLQQPVWKLSWSVTGGILAVSDSKGNVTLWKEAIDGQWQQISQDAAAA